MNPSPPNSDAARTVASGGTVLEVSEKILTAITRRDNPQAVVGVFAFFTIGGMLAAVALGYVGLTRARLGVFEQKIDVLAGLTVAASGAAVLFLGA